MSRKRAGVFAPTRFWAAGRLCAADGSAPPCLLQRDGAAGETGRVTDAVQPPGRAELRRSVAGPLAVAATATALGLDSADSAQVLGWYDAIVDSVTGVAAGRPTTRAGDEAFAELRAAIEP